MHRRTHVSRASPLFVSKQPPSLPTYLPYSATPPLLLLLPTPLLLPLIRSLCWPAPSLTYRRVTECEREFLTQFSFLRRVWVRFWFLSNFLLLLYIHVFRVSLEGNTYVCTIFCHGVQICMHNNCTAHTYCITSLKK